MSDATARLHREAAAMGARLGRLIAATPRGADGRWENAISFLSDAFDAASGGVALDAWETSLGSMRPEPDTLDRLVERFGLAPVEADLLVLAGLAEEHEGYASVLRLLHPAGEPRATAGLAAQVLCRSFEERRFLRRTLEEGAAVSAGVLRLGADSPFGERTLTPAEGLWSALGGLEAWPRGLRVSRDAAVLAGLEEWLDSPAAGHAVAAIAANRPILILVSCEHAETGIARALALASRAGRTPVTARMALSRSEEDLKAVSAHCVAHDVVPVLVAPAAPEGIDAATPCCDSHPGVVIAVAHSSAAVTTRRPVLLVPMSRLRPAERRRAWHHLFPALADESHALAARYSLEPGQIATVVRDVTAVVGAGEAPTLEAVAAAVRARGDIELGAGMSLVHPVAVWGDLVLRSDRLAQLLEAVDRLRLQSVVFDEWGFPDRRAGARGVRLLFAGPPGTGKSLAAEAMAAALGVDLLLVDLSRLVSKWLGETEKNLARVFERAERAQAVLLFDEADALFARRTEVSDAHDRYANLETAYLLSRLERFDGLAILATNLKEHIDPAFLRRLEFVIDFDEPGVVEREELWRTHIPERAPLAADVVLAELAELYPIVGGLIRNASLAAGFLATADGGTITRNHLLHAVRREYEKAGRAFPGVPADYVGV